MTSLAIAMVAVTTWNYAGFMADPAPPPPVPPAPAVNPVVPPSPPGNSSPRLDSPAPATKALQLTRHEAKTQAPPAVVAAPLPVPTRYQMADLSGQVWEHADPAVLQAFVEAQNARMVFPRPGSTRRFSR